MTRAARRDADGPAGARRAPLVDWIEPSLCTLVDKAPAGAQWLHEIKLDGYRILARLDAGRVRLLSRNRKDWTVRFDVVARAVASLPARRALLDGEVVIVEQDGTTSFQALQNAIEGADDARLTYFVFDLLHLDDFDLTGVALAERKRLLAALLERSVDAGVSGVLRYNDHVEGRGPEFFEQACRHSLEGVIAKRADAPHRSGRSRDWLKIKCLQEQEFVIGGFTEGAGSRTGFGALLLGVYEGGEGLRYAGKVGTGFTEASLRRLSTRLAKLERKTPAFAAVPAELRRGVHWVAPELVAEVAFLGWTREGRLRHPSFRGLREDRAAREVVREVPLALPQQPRASGARVAVRAAGIRVSNPSKVLFADPGITKGELAAYYEMVAPWMLPHIADRPLTLLRCPDGYEGECFFQKSAEGLADEIQRVRIPDARGGEESVYAAVRDAAGLLALVQTGVLEFHIWGSRAQHLELPDRITFDLDPGPGIGWDEVLEGAQLVRATLAKLGLRCLPMLTGGKGLHVVVPVRPEYDWAIVKEFSHAVVQTIVRSEPQRYTAHLAKVRRERRIFIDYLRNGRGATAVAPYSTRARAGAAVAVPLDWKELSPSLRPDAFHVRDLAQRMKSLGRDPWMRAGVPPQSLRAVLESGRGAAGKDGAVRGSRRAADSPRK